MSPIVEHEGGVLDSMSSPALLIANSAGSQDTDPSHHDGELMKCLNMSSRTRFMRSV